MPIESQEGQDYIRDMEWSQQYAFHNRRMMKEILLDIIGQVTGHEADLNNSVNIHHNYCQCEDCGDDRKLWVTRKGATSQSWEKWVLSREAWELVVTLHEEREACRVGIPPRMERDEKCQGLWRIQVSLRRRLKSP
jgi:RNA-splicing ligase RtcB